MRPLYVAFVGVKRNPSDLPPDYFPTFVKFHLELPWYYARFSDCRVHLTTTEPVDYSESFNGNGTISSITEGQYLDQDYKPNHHPYDVVVHWRKWHDDLYMPGARNVVLTQDHSYSSEWKNNVLNAFSEKKLDGILVFPTWHKQNTFTELGGIIPLKNLYEGMTLGVDTDIYTPEHKNKFSLLWASDPGRGLDRLIHPFLNLWKMDRRFTLTVTYPDYVKPESVARFSSFLSHPGVRHITNVRNGPALWSLFNTCSFLPYSSNFMEPSSRCHRQAMAAGCMVLYPPSMGTPSALIENGLTGIVEEPELWPTVINNAMNSGRVEEIGRNARSFAISENWSVQASRFYNFFSKDLK